MLDGKQVSKKFVGSEDERAVSPVIGVILMVAITVILAAVIAAFVLDLGGSVGEEPQAGVAVEPEAGDNVTVSVTSMGNSDGVAVVNNSGGVVTPAESSGDHVFLTSSGASAEINASDVDAVSVVAWIGPDVDPDDHDTLDAAEATASVASIDN